MNWEELLFNNIGRLPPQLVKWIEKRLRNIPSVSQKIEKEYDEMMADLESSLKPYKGEFASFTKIPEIGRAREEILQEMEALHDHEQAIWEDGFVSGAVYHGDQEHIDFLNKVYAINSQSNPLHADVWPSATKFEAEIVAMTADMLGGAGQDICGTVSSGGTESIMLAMKTYRDRARQEKGITRPEMVVPITAHAAFDKASQYFNIKTVHIPVDENFRADVNAARRAITRNTVVIVGSAPSFPHGAIDPIAELSELAREHGIGFHTDACLGGFVLPWAEKLGYSVPPFRLPFARRHIHVRGYAQVWLRCQRHLGCALSRKRFASLPVLHRHRLARRAVLLTYFRGQPPRRVERRLLGGYDYYRRRWLPGSYQENPGNGRDDQERHSQNP